MLSRRTHSGAVPVLVTCTLAVTLPRTGNVIVEWSIGAGEYTGPDTNRDGIDLKGSYQRILTPGAPVLTVVLHTGLGEVTVS